MRKAAARMWRDFLSERIVEGWIHQDTASTPGREALGRKGACGRGDVENDRACKCTEPVAPNIVARKCYQGWIYFDQREPEIVHPTGERKASSTHAGSEVNRMLARRRIGRRSEQDRIVTDPMTAPRLP